MTKLCKICKAPNPNPLIKTCGYQCASAWLKTDKGKAAQERALKRNQAKAERDKKAKAHRKKKSFYENDRTHQKKLMQAAFNLFIRTKYKGKGCYTCDEKNPNRQYQCGHYLTVGGRKDRRTDERNARLQCVSCNKFNGGRPALFRENLIAEIGIEQVLDLETNHNPGYKQSIDEIRAIRKYYDDLNKAVKNN